MDQLVDVYDARFAGGSSFSIRKNYENKIQFYIGGRHVKAAGLTNSQRLTVKTDGKKFSIERTGSATRGWLPGKQGNALNLSLTPTEAISHLFSKVRYRSEQLRNVKVESGKISGEL